jgi:hypothetical protein
VLKPQDIVVLLKLAGEEGGWTFGALADELSMSASAVHRSLARAADAGLYDDRRRRVIAPALLEFAVHGAKYLCPGVLGGEARGIPTAWAAPPLAKRIAASDRGIPVWPHALGKARGIALDPLHPTVPEAAQRDSTLAEKLALLDAIRIGDARQRAVAERELTRRLDGDARR